MKIGFIGLGNLGLVMAQRLISQGIELTVWNRTIDRAKGLKADVASSPADLLSKTEMVFLNLADSIAVKNVIEGKSGFIDMPGDGKIIVDTSTNHFEKVLEFRRTLAAHGIDYLEAPVMGSVVPAAAGNLTILVSGDRTPYERARPIMQVLGKNIFYLEKPSLATKMKLINNLVLGSLMAAIAEAVAFGEAAGIGKDKVLEILSGGAGNSAVLNGKKEMLLKEDFTPQFSSVMMYKDLHYLQDLARTLHRPLWMAGAVKELFALTYQKGFENLDFSAVYKVLK